MPSILYNWFGSKDQPAVGPPNCEEKMEECAAECKRKNPDCAPTSGGRRKKSLKKGGRKSRKSRHYRSTSRGSKSRRLKSRA